MPFAIGLLVVGAVAAFFVLSPAASAAGAVASAAGGATGGSAASSGDTSGTTATSTGSGGTNGQTPTGWAHDLLNSIGAPITPANVKSIVDWENMEGGNWNNDASYNPLNTTYSGSGITGNSINSVGVKAYSSWQQGLQATVNTLDSSDYSDIISALKAGNGLTGDISGLSTWSGGGYDSIS